MSENASMLALEDKKLGEVTINPSPLHSKVNNLQMKPCKCIYGYSLGSRMAQTQHCQEFSRQRPEVKSRHQNGQTNEYETLRVSLKQQKLTFKTLSNVSLFKGTCTPWASRCGRSGSGGTLSSSRCPSTRSPSAATRRKSPTPVSS